jgi:hypothetical protein
MLLKRAQRGQLGLVEAVKRLQGEVLAAPSGETDARKVALLLLGAAYQKFGAKIEEQQEVLASISDVIIDAFAIESVTLRARKSGNAMGLLVAEVFQQDALTRVETAARNVLAACAEGDALRTQLAVLRRFVKQTPTDAFAARRRIAARLAESGRL